MDEQLEGPEGGTLYMDRRPDAVMALRNEIFVQRTDDGLVATVIHQDLGGGFSTPLDEGEIRALVAAVQHLDDAARGSQGGETGH